ncbi:MAG: pitrilysin family protein [Bacteroidia bacterium]|nr:insulinase family protein [Bacteroidia bacterium]MDW8159739.1 pitrilysin family protein [Bacteroidia bacterium]
MDKSSISSTLLAPDIMLFELSNGLRVIHKMLYGSRLVYCGIIFDLGSRDEPLAGMVHFIEHMLFKGTQTKSVLQILNRLDIVGGELNAYTTKEKTCLHATVTRRFYARALELLIDMAFHSIFPAGEIEKEKKVIAEEIEMYSDTPEESISDEFEALIFPGHPLGNPILGTKETLLQFTKENLFSFYKQYYTPSRAIISIISGSPFSLTEKIIRELAPSNLPSNGAILERKAPSITAAAQKKILKRPIQQAHFILGSTAYPAYHPRWPTFNLLINHLGGPFMNSRLNLSIREKYGLTYNLYAFYNAFCDSGIWGVYAGTEPSSTEKVLELVQQQLYNLQKEPMHPKNLEKIKRQHLGFLEIARENHNNQLMQQARDLLALGRIQTLEEYAQLVQNITPEELQSVAIEMFDTSKLNLLIYEPA